jgi:hypothetical protein
VIITPNLMAFHSACISQGFCRSRWLGQAGLGSSCFPIGQWWWRSHSCVRHAGLQAQDRSTRAVGKLGLKMACCHFLPAYCLSQVPHIEEKFLFSSSSFLFFFCSTRAWTQGLPLGPLHQPFFCDGFFWDRVSQTILPGLSLKLDPPDFCLLSS